MTDPVELLRTVRDLLNAGDDLAALVAMREFFHVSATPLPEPKPKRGPSRNLSLIDKLAELSRPISLRELAAIYIDGDRSLANKCQALNRAIKSDGIPWRKQGNRKVFDPVLLIEHIQKRSFISKKPQRANGQNIKLRIAASRKK
jgi:hypothetical protein